MSSRLFERRTCGALLIAATLIGTAGCVETRGRLYVNLGPPAPIIETRAVAPGPGYIWIDGYQRWDGNRYVWVAGRWDRPPRPRALWQAGHWARDRRGWYYVDGRWR